MCRATVCKICGKTTWTGCGQHVDQVKAQVPAGQWCPGHDDAGHDQARRASGGFVRRLLGRR